jgi:hypothetical protein
MKDLSPSTSKAVKKAQKYLASSKQMMTGSLIAACGVTLAAILSIFANLIGPWKIELLWQAMFWFMLAAFNWKNYFQMKYQTTLYSAIVELAKD